MALKDNLPPVHPGEYIADGIHELKLSQSDLADILGCSRQLVSDIVKGRRSLSMEICFGLAAVLGSTAEDWSNLQHRFDLKTAKADPKMQKAFAEAKERMAARAKAAPAPAKKRPA